MNKNTLIPVMFGPYEDEMVDSWIVRLAHANCMEPLYFCKTYLKKNLDIKNKSWLPCNLNGLFWCSQTVIGFPKADELLMFHSLIPILEYMKTPVMTIARMTQCILYNDDIQGYDLDYIKTYQQRVVCPHCLNDASAKGMFPYLKVWHQFPGVRVCAIHKCQLISVGKNYDYTTFSNEERGDEKDDDIDFAEKIYSLYLNTRSMSNYRAVRTNINENLVSEKTNGVFLYASCRLCRTKFLTTNYALMKGRWCPVCDRNADIIGRQLDMIPEYNSVRKIRSTGETKVIRHCCGRILSWSAGDILWNGMRCGCGQTCNFELP